MKMQETDIRPTELFQTYLRLCEEDSKTFFADVSTKAIDCPACGCQDSKESFVKWTFGYSVCSRCATLFQTPRSDLGAFQKFYTSSRSSDYWTTTFFPAVAEARREKLFRHKANDIFSLAEGMPISPKTVIDVGAGFGILLEEMRKIQPDKHYIALEPNSEMANICRANGLEVIEAFAEQTGTNVKGDIVIALEVLEHVHSPLDFCKSIHGMLTSKGRALFTTLTCSGFDIQLLWDKSPSVSPPHHLNFMSTTGLTTLMSRAGFSNVKLYTPGKLDIDIVATAVRNGTLPRPPRFVESLLSLSKNGKREFQTFLQHNQLSSHCWIWAER